MKQTVNLLPKSTILWLERQYQFQWWIRTWFIIVLFLSIITTVIHQSRQVDNKRLQMALESIVKIRDAASQLETLQAKARGYRESVEFAANLEQCDLPLSLIQTIGECCHSLKDKMQLKSLKLTEAPIVQRKGTSARSSGQIDEDSRKSSQMVKQVVLSGVASPEACSMLIAALKRSKVFDAVELVSTQSVSEQSLSLQLFQIRCDR